MSAFHVIPTWASGQAEIYGRRLKEQEPYMTASTAIDPKPLPTCLRGDDIPVESCCFVKASLPCHSNVGKWASGNLWKAI